MTKRITEQLNTEIATLKAELEDARRLAGARKGALETAEHQIDQLMKQDRWQLARIRELEASNKERWDRIQNHERDRVRLLERLEQQGTNHASDHLELVARREACDKLAAELEQMTVWRDRADERADKLDTVTDNQTRQLIAQNNELVDLRRKLKECQDLNEGQNEVIIELRGECTRLGKDRSMTAADYGMTEVFPTLEVAACACDDLQESLGNLHKACKSVVLALPMGTSAITLVEAMTRSRDLLDELAPAPVAPTPAPTKRPPVPADDQGW